LIAKPLRAISPGLKIKLLVWLQRARKACFLRHQAFVVMAQAETNALIRKAVLKENEILIKEEGSDDSSCFSMGSADSHDDDSNISEVSVMEIMKRSGFDFEQVFGRFDDMDMDDDMDDDANALSRKRQSAPATLHVGNSAHERNIFQRGIHKIEKRILGLNRAQSSVSESQLSVGAADGADRLPQRRSLVERGIHKVVKKISFTGANTDKHLHEAPTTSPSPSHPHSHQDESRSPQSKGGSASEMDEEDDRMQKESSQNIVGWFSRTKTT
jgi:hypothetical protein